MCLFKIGSSVAQTGLEPAICKDLVKFPILLSPPEFWLHAPWLLTDICMSMEVLRYSGNKFPLVCLLLTVTGLAHLLMVPQKWHLRVHGAQSIAQWHQWGQQFHQPHVSFLYVPQHRWDNSEHWVSQTPLQQNFAKGHTWTHFFAGQQLWAAWIWGGSSWWKHEEVGACRATELLALCTMYFSFWRLL